MGDWRLICERCGSQQPLGSMDWRCGTCGGAFALEGQAEFSSSRIIRERRSLWRYDAFLPVASEQATTLGEGLTPLLRGHLAGREVWLKNDAMLPTGSFKDRGAAVVVSHLRGLGVSRVVVDSSGNAAAAMSGYCAAAGIECVVYAPASTSPAKLTQSRAFGAAVVLVEGNRDAVAEAAQQAVLGDGSVYYASHNWNPVFVEGVKTWAMEVWEQLGERSPDHAFVPTGGGSALVGALRGFETLGSAIPALVAAQPAACAPIVDALDEGADTIAAVTPGETLAEGTRIGNPSRPGQILAAVRKSGGWGQAVSEDALKQALRTLWRQGIYVEPTAAVGAAAFVDAVEAGRLPEKGETVILLTGSGLKATETIARLVQD